MSAARSVTLAVGVSEGKTMVLGAIQRGGEIRLRVDKGKKRLPKTRCIILYSKPRRRTPSA